MSEEKLVLESGVKHMPVVDENGVDTGRCVIFNPSDAGFAEDLYGLVSKISGIHEKAVKKQNAATDPAMRFDINRAEDAEMRAAVDALFGDGFCADVFRTRLFAMAGGLTVAENFLYALIDKMDASINENMAKRDSKIRKYTDKYKKYAKK